MRFKLIRFFLPVLLIGFISCNSDKEYIETVVEEGSPGTIVHTDWKSEPQQKPKTKKKKRSTTEKKSTKKSSPSRKKDIRDSFQLQLGAFVNEANAINLIKKVEKKGYQPYIEDSIFKDKKWYFVKVGPFRQKKQAIKTANRLTSILKTDIIVLKNKTLLERIKAPPQTIPKKKASNAKTAQLTKATNTTRKRNKTKKSSISKTQTASNNSEKQKKKTVKFKSKANPKANKAKYPYSFQIGGLFTLENAKKQLKKFKLSGYSPYLVAVNNEINKEKWYSVRIGRFKTMKDAVDEATVFSIKEQIPTKPQPINY